MCISRVWRSGNEMSECLGMVGGYMNQEIGHLMLRWDPRGPIKPVGEVGGMGLEVDQAK